MTEKFSPGVAIVGCGLIGQKRARWLGPARLLACVDVDLPRAQTLAGKFKGCQAYAELEPVVQRPDIDIVIVATTNQALAPATEAVLKAGKHVLVEKPAARSLAEAEKLAGLLKTSRGFARVGFNHRYHPAFQKAYALFKEGALGEMMFIRGRYGHGGRVGYEKEWRANPEISGGGELMDQGVHLIDLAGWFLGDFTSVSGWAHTYFWDMKVDDNAFLMLRNATDQMAFLQVSCTEWKNLFSFEIYGKNAKLHIEGIGGSYGVERLYYYKMLPEMGPPETMIWEYPGEDKSWQVEFAEFLEDIRLNRRPATSLEHLPNILRIVNSVYQGSGYDHHA